MKHLAEILAQPTCRTLARALVHFLWQGTLVALLLGAGNAILRRHSSRARYFAACAALAVMLALPAITVWRLGAPSAPAGHFAAASGSPAAALVPSAIGRETARVQTDTVAALAPWIVLTWLSGVSFFSVRFLGGFLAVHRLRHRRTRRPGDPWERRLAELAARLRVTRPVRLLESALVEVPTAVGVLRPVILLPAGILTGMASDQLDSLLAHELAHVRRSDCLVNLFQAMAETLLFYHPAVWWVSARIRVERENACDDLAVAVTGDAGTYARALVNLAERRDGVPRLAVAADGGPLWRRITRLVPPPQDSASSAPRWLAAAMALGGALALGAAAQVPAADAPGEVPPAATQAPRAPRQVRDAPAAGAASREEPAPRADSGTAPAAAPAPRALLTPEQLIAFRIHGVTPEFLGEIVALGYTKASPEELVALRIHGVTPEYIAQMTAIFGKLPLERFTEFRIHGLTPESSGPLEAAFGKLTPDEAVSLRIHGVDAGFARAFRDAGYASLSADEAVSLRIHGVDPADAGAWKRLGFGIPSIDDLLSLRIHGATPEFAGALRAQGLGQLTLDDLVAFRIHGVTPEFVREIRALGYTSLSADDLTSFRIHGVTADWIRASNRRAGGTLSADELIDGRIHEHRTDQAVEEEP